MVDVKMVVVRGVRYRKEDAPNDKPKDEPKNDGDEVEHKMRTPRKPKSK